MGATVAVVSTTLDLHAAAVVWGLRKKGVEARLVTFSQCALEGTISILLDGAQSARILLNDAQGRTVLDEFDGFWLRRGFVLPELPPGLPGQDARIAELEWREFLRSIYLVLAHRGKYCLNHPASTDLELAKSFQLELAREIGFRVPRTCIGSDLTAVRSMFGRTGRVAYKTISPNNWSPDGPGLDRSTSTCLLSLDQDVWRNFSLSPGIVQEYVEKKYETRVTVIGGDVVCVGIDSQGVEEARIDWRAPQVYTRPGAFFHIAEPPRAIRKRILRYCEATRLEFCTFDFIVTPTDEWIFLEANRSGQFLFCEAMVPEVALLDKICGLLAQRSGARTNGAAVTYGEFHVSAEGTEFRKRWRASQAPKAAA